MKMMVNNKPDHVGVRLAETLGIACIHDAKEKFGQLLAMGRDLVVDLSGLEEIDTAGIQFLMLVKREADRNGFECRFAHPRSNLAETMEYFHLPGLLVGPESTT